MTTEIAQQIVNICRLASKADIIPLHEPDFNGTKAWEYVKDCLDSGWVSTAGGWVTRFENELAQYTKAPHVVAVTNGTVALRLALHLVGVRIEDEVLMPSLSFVATANAASHLGAHPHFVDIEDTSLGLCAEKLERHLANVAIFDGEQLINRVTKRRIAAVVLVHVFGHPANASDIKKVADKWNLPLVEDAAEALGSWRQQTHCGLFGDIGCFSFNGNKLITTGGGGALLLKDARLAERARHLSTTAKINHPWDFVHDEIGWNDRLPNLNASIGVAQLEDLERRLQAKRKLALLYADCFSSDENVEVLEEPRGCTSNYWLISLRFKHDDVMSANQLRLEVINHCHKQGILVRPVWKPLHSLVMYKDCPSTNLSVTEEQSFRLLSLPSSPQLLYSL